MITIAIVGPSNISSNSAFLSKDDLYFIELANDVGALLAQKGFPIITVPYKGVGYFAAKKYIESKGEKLIGVMPKGMNSDISVKELVTVENWISQPEALVSRANVMIVIGLSAGTMMEICLTKRFKKYPILIFEKYLTSIPKEIENELNITYINNIDDIEETLNYMF